MQEQLTKSLRTAEASAGNIEIQNNIKVHRFAMGRLVDFIFFPYLCAIITFALRKSDNGEMFSEIFL